MNAKRMALITGSCLAAGLAGCAGNSPLNPESLLSQFNPPKP